MVKYIADVVTQSIETVSSGFITLSTTQGEIKEQLTKFLKEDLPEFLSKTTEDLGADFQMGLHTVDIYKYLARNIQN